jgi:DNA-binding PadR family transcriptional regulator
MAPTRPDDTAQPLKPLVFQILLALVDDGRPGRTSGRHGWSLVREVQQRGSFGRIMPGNFYRTLRGILADGLIEDATGRGTREGDERRRYFRLTARGADAAAAEARRLEALVAESRSKRLLTSRSRP